MGVCKGSFVEEESVFLLSIADAMHMCVTPWLLNPSPSGVTFSQG